MIKRNSALKFLFVFALAILLRLYGLHWDQGNYFHPDERFLTMVTNDLKLPASFSEYLDPVKSPLNPYNSKYTFFVYGTFPVNLNKLLVSLFNSDDYYSIGIYGRVVSALFDLATLLLVFLTVRLWERFYNINPNIKYYSAFFYAIAVLPIQLAHFFTVDSFLAFFMFASFYFAVRSCFYNKLLNVALAGVLFGFGVGTKVSAIYILPLLLLLFVLEKDRVLSPSSLFKGLPLKILKGVLFLSLAYLSLRVADPRFFASGDFLNFKINPRFIANIRELAGSGDYGEGLPSPPSVQWMNSIPVVFALKNIIIFGVGIPYFMLAMFGAWWLYKKKARETFFILIWALCFFLWQSSQFVKTMRYFCSLYPFIAILAGCGFYYLTARLSAFRHKKYIVAATVAAVLIWPFSFMQIYTRPHSRVLASEWIYKNIPENSKIAQIHWDDFLPVSVPGYQRRYDIIEMPIFGPDDETKWATMNSDLERADYIIFSSNRGYGSIMPHPDKYPRMAPYFKDLFQNKTDFRLIADITSLPTLNLGFIKIPLNDQWAEEAFTVYDHPRITVFKKQDKKPVAFSNAVTNEEGMSSLAAAALWLLLLQALALAVLPVLSVIFSGYSDKAYGLSKTAGFFFFGLITWLIPSYVNIPANSQLCAFVFFLLLAVGWKKSGGIDFYRKFFRENRKHIIRVEALFMGGFFFFLAIRWSNPEIFWGEKPMDSSLLSYFTRSEIIPPTDPWSSGTNMRYYYLGSYIISSLLKISGISPAIGYNLAIASVPAFCMASLYTLFAFITRKKNFAVFASLCVIFLSNLEIMNLVLFQGKEINFDTFWASTRLFTSPAFTEYPLWSYLFADLHAHVIAQIVCAMVLAIIPAFLNSRDNKISRVQIVVLGVCFSSLMLLNSWDFLSYGLLISLGFAVKLFFSGGTINSAKIKMLAKEVLILALCGAVVTIPYQLASNPAAGVYWGWNGDKEYNEVLMIIRHFGSWLIISVLAALLLIKKSSTNSQISSLKITLVSLVSLLPIGLGMIGFSKDLVPPPWGVLILSSLLIQFSLLILLFNKNKSVLMKFSCLGLLTFSLLLGVIEMLFLIDRMNTIFKFYYSLWMIISSSALAFSAYLFAGVKKKKLGEIVYVLSARTIAIALIIICLTGSLLNIWTTIINKRTDGPRFTLNGQAYLANTDLPEYEMIKWINQNIKGAATLLEAQGDSYGPFTRIVMHTGLSTVLGWEYHTKQRGTKDWDIQDRKRHVREIYSTADAAEAEKLLNLYGVHLIVVGKLEQATYPAAGLAKFEKHPELFPLLFKSESTALYTRSKVLLSNGNDSKLELKWK
jgi:YYY domain-containing protein